jgi:predicted kinase
VEAVLFMGIRASGKSTFYQERFSCTHVRINLDMLKTRINERGTPRGYVEILRRHAC